VRAANMKFVSFVPAWGTYTTGNLTIYACISGTAGSYNYDFSCTNANAVFYPWLP
jgi:hypothetical protein